MKHENLMKRFGDAFSQFDRLVELEVQLLSDEELAQLLKAYAQLSTTNCWWATFASRQVATDAVRREQQQRSQQTLESA
jgi:hypothetical protein